VSFVLNTQKQKQIGANEKKVQKNREMPFNYLQLCYNTKKVFFVCANFSHLGRKGPIHKQSGKATFVLRLSF